MTNVMLDLETLGQSAGAVILSIGAVKFSGGVVSRVVSSEFYRRISPQSCVNVGLKIDPDTVMWWMKQGDAARSEIVKDGINVSLALMEFSKWVGDPDALVWGNGADFDNVLLASAYRAVNLPLPWKYYNNRCYRTIKSLNKDIKIERSGTHHNALDDARSQAFHLMRCLS